MSYRAQGLPATTASPGFSDLSSKGAWLERIRISRNRFLPSRSLAAVDYDPKRDPIVRTEAMRLRARLDEYYAGLGREDGVVIELPKGEYVPAFRRRGILPGASENIDARHRARGVHW